MNLITVIGPCGSSPCGEIFMLRALRFATVPLALAAILALALPILAGGVATSAHAAEFADNQRDEIKEIVHEYLLEHPEVIAEAIMELRKRQQQEEDAQNQGMLKEYSNALFATPTDAVLGNPNGDVTLVEFFDYRCGYCKAVFPQLTDVVHSDGNVRLVMKEMPILGAESVMAAQWSVAALKLDGYEAFHSALMTHKGNVTLDLLKSVAKDSGLDPEKMAKVAQSKEVGDELQASLDLARALNISGTPAFVIGDVLVPGAIGADQLKALIDQQRSKQKK
jgi:protein-disulfide isomerase